MREDTSLPGRRKIELPKRFSAAGAYGGSLFLLLPLVCVSIVDYGFTSCIYKTLRTRGTEGRFAAGWSTLNSRAFHRALVQISVLKWTTSADSTTRTSSRSLQIRARGPTRSPRRSGRCSQMLRPRDPDPARNLAKCCTRQLQSRRSRKTASPNQPLCWYIRSPSAQYLGSSRSVCRRRDCHCRNYSMPRKNHSSSRQLQRRRTRCR